MLFPPKILPLENYAELPAKFMQTRASKWTDLKGHYGRLLGGGLEGSAFDNTVNIYFSDIPFGRIPMASLPEVES